MTTETLSNGNHEFRVSTVPLLEGRWTHTIVHAEHTVNSVVETRLDSSAVYNSEQEALEQGLFSAKQVAKRRGIDL
ncbi:hypothetical protein [Burkholderia ubonensis]|uniref:hypothetical protein n=1 Tax=Burkholderia ubonensis TaxID=101571 RepID=UPI000A826E8A|nr:hypothetical protein [Burkholderia ubonensis]